MCAAVRPRGNILSGTMPKANCIINKMEQMEGFNFEVLGEFIKIPIEGHSVIINTDTDEVFLDGDKVNTNIGGRPYTSEYRKPDNTKGWKKWRVKAIPTKDHAIVVDIGWNGRVFILYFTKQEYKAFRGKPMKQYSYWNNGKRKDFYEDDLSNACWVKTRADL